MGTGGLEDSTLGSKYPDLLSKKNVFNEPVFKVAYIFLPDLTAFCSTLLLCMLNFHLHLERHNQLTLFFSFFSFSLFLLKYSFY